MTQPVYYAEKPLPPPPPELYAAGTPDYRGFQESLPPAHHSELPPLQLEPHFYPRSSRKGGRDRKHDHGYEPMVFKDYQDSRSRHSHHGSHHGSFFGHLSSPLGSHHGSHHSSHHGSHHSQHTSPLSPYGSHYSHHSSPLSPYSNHTGHHGSPVSPHSSHFNSHHSSPLSPHSSQFGSHHGSHHSHRSHRSHHSDKHSEHKHKHDTDKDKHKDAAWVGSAARAYAKGREKLPDAVADRLPDKKAAKDSLGGLSARMSGLTAAATSSDKRAALLKAQRAKLKSDILSHGFSVANGTQVPLHISLNQVGPLMYETVKPGRVFERRAPGLFFVLEVRASGRPYDSWSVTWPILAVAGPSVAAAALLAAPLVGGGLGGVGAAVSSGLSAANSSLTAASTTVATTAAKVAAVPGGGMVKSKLVEAAKSQAKAQVAEPLKQKGTEKLLRYATVAAAAATGRAHTQDNKHHHHHRSSRKVLAEVDVTGYPLDKVLRCKTGKHRLDEKLERAFEKLDFKTRDFQPKSDPVLRVVGGPDLEERGHKQFLVFHPLQLEHVVDLKAEPLPMQLAPPTDEERRLAHDARIANTWEEASERNKGAPMYEGHSPDPNRQPWLDSWR